MPNYCTYTMRVRGEKKNIETFYNWLDATYNYGCDGIKVWNIPDGKTRWNTIEESEKIPCEHHIGYRVFEADKLEEWEDDNKSAMEITGECAWSVYSSMCDGDFTYMEENKELDTLGKRKAISIADASKELGLEIELFSSEPGMQFAEHYYFNNGDWILNNTAEYIEWDDEHTEEAVDITCEYLTDDLEDWLWEYIER